MGEDIVAAAILNFVSFQLSGLGFPIPPTKFAICTLEQQKETLKHLAQLNWRDPWLAGMFDTQAEYCRVMINRLKEQGIQDGCKVGRCNNKRCNIVICCTENCTLHKAIEINDGNFVCSFNCLEELSNDN